MCLLGIILALLTMWIIFLVADKLALLLCHWEERQRDKRIRRNFQIYLDPIGEANRKDPDIFNKLFDGVKPLKSIPKDIFKR